MRSLKSLTLAACASFTFLFLALAPTARAQAPRYLHAISDLRAARAYLQMDPRPQFARMLQHAIDEITKSITDMKVAAADDGKNPYRTPPPQSGGDGSAPVHSALRLLNEAHDDVAFGVDFPQNIGLQIRSLKHIEEARHILQNIINANQ